MRVKIRVDLKKGKSHFKENDKANNSDGCYRCGCMPTLQGYVDMYMHQLSKGKRLMRTTVKLTSLDFIFYISQLHKIPKAFLTMWEAMFGLSKTKIHY